MHNDNILLHNNRVKFTFRIDYIVKAGTFLFLLLLFASWVQAQNLNIPDASFKAVLVANTSINSNNDTEIQVSEATAFAGALDVSDKSIVDLKGIEAFINLTELKCNDNQLTSLIVSSNTALEVLQCYRNQLTSLDLSTNTALQILQVQKNQLVSLDVSANNNLFKLDCFENSLSSLNLNTGLSTLICYANQLTSLDLGTGNQLKFLDRRSKKN